MRRHTVKEVAIALSVLEENTRRNEGEDHRIEKEDPEAEEKGRPSDCEGGSESDKGQES